MKNLLLFFAIILSSEKIIALEIVSLGFRCMIANAARYNKLRNTAYPFDWMRTSIEALKSAIQDDFKQVLLSEQLYERDDHKAVIDGYGFIFSHDFPTIKQPMISIDDKKLPFGVLASNWRDSIDIVREKFNRRLERLLKLLQDGTPVALVRYDGINFDTAEEFVVLLQQKYPRAKAVLVVIGTTPEFKKPWNISHVRNLYIDEKDLLDFKSSAWKNIMLEITAMDPKNWSDYDTQQFYRTK